MLNSEVEITHSKDSSNGIYMTHIRRRRALNRLSPRARSFDMISVVEATTICIAKCEQEGRTAFFANRNWGWCEGENGGTARALNLLFPKPPSSSSHPHRGHWRNLQDDSESVLPVVDLREWPTL